MSYPEFNPLVATTPNYQLDDTLRLFEAISDQGEVREVRILNGVPYTGYFDRSSSLAKALQTLSPAPNNVYITLNPVRPDLLARANNHFVRAHQTTADADVLQRTSFLVDIDPVRPSGIPSSDEEHEAALQRADEVRRSLSSLGWAEPTFIDSGNGAHLLYRIDLPTADDGIVRRTLDALDVLFSDATLAIDTSVSNPARLTRLPGWINAKGDGTAERPHRLARLMAVPSPLKPVTREQLESVASCVPGSATGKSTPLTGVTLADRLAAAGIAVHRVKNAARSEIHVLERCPLDETHKLSSFVGRFHNGGYFGRCLHASCQFQGWRDISQRLDLVPSNETSRDERAWQDLTSMMLQEVPEPEWLIDGILLKGHVHSIYGAPGAGKSLFALALAKEVTARGRTVCYLDEEMGRQNTVHRLVALQFGPEQARRLKYLPFPSFRLEDAPEFRALVEKVRPDLLIIDPLADCLSVAGLDEDSARDVTNWMRAFADSVAMDFGSAVLLLDHPPKSPSATTQRGSGAKAGKVDAVFHLTAETALHRDGLGRLKLTCQKNRPGLFASVKRFELGREGISFVFRQADAHAVTTEQASDRTRVLEFARERGSNGVTNRDVRSLLDVDERRSLQLLTSLVPRYLKRDGAGPSTRYVAVHTALGVRDE